MHRSRQSIFWGKLRCIAMSEKKIAVKHTGKYDENTKGVIKRYPPRVADAIVETGDAIILDLDPVPSDNEIKEMAKCRDQYDLNDVCNFFGETLGQDYYREMVGGIHECSNCGLNNKFFQKKCRCGQDRLPAIKNIFKDFLPGDHYKILGAKDLYEMIDREFDKKIFGELKARKAIFFTFNMRNVKNLSRASDNLMVNDPAGTGKDYVVKAIFDLLPNEEKVQKLRITPKVLSYMNDSKKNPEGWTKKCLYLEDVTNTTLNDDAFKVMSSCDPDGVSHVSVIVQNFLKNISIKGKPSIVLTTATANPKPELLRRYPIVNLTGTVDQTKAILKKQAKMAASGEVVQYNPKITEALCKLKRIKVTIPFAPLIADIFPVGDVIVRTHFPRFLDYIKSSTALYQYQREIDENGSYLAQEEDYNLAREILASTTSNQLMIPLTNIQKKILEKFSQLEKKAYSIQEMETQLTSLNITYRYISSQLQKLASYGFLERSNEAKDGAIRPVAVYSFREVHKIEIPEFSDLEKCSKCSFSSNCSYSSNCSNWKEKAVQANLSQLERLELKEQKERRKKNEQ